MLRRAADDAAAEWASERQARQNGEATQRNLLATLAARDAAIDEMRVQMKNTRAVNNALLLTLEGRNDPPETLTE